MASILGWFAIPSLANHVFQNSSLWPIHLGWSHMAWLIVSLSYASPFTMTRQLYMNGITLSIKVMVFPVVTYRCESWILKKAERQRIDAFELWCWRRLLRVLWTARRSNQAIIRELNPEYSLEGLMLKLKLQHFDHLIRTANSLEKSLC